MSHSHPGSAPTAGLDGWERAPFTAAGITHEVLRKGSGPGVVLLPELPGITPEVLGLAQHLVDAGFAVAVPSLFGTPGRRATAGAMLTVTPKVCVAKEFRALATDAERPVAAYVRALARDLAGRTEGPGVGVVGMCFTGGFALAAAVEKSVLAPVLSQPSVPLPLGSARRGDPGVSERELAEVRRRAREDGLCLLGLRFSRDGLSPAERFTGLRRAFGDAFEVIELDSGPGNPAGLPASAHEVLTVQVREQEDHPAQQARARVVAFLRERLG
ncbi:dienelactone hydrolase family protein [Streptacidiphilus jiangxiensis]|uniref:Dienelactone hydrolase n=1 Tax=Streptacidiphilus jiangxiensis TaxID=235985 RepID=A0A1H7KIM2_STRJI|nr:dienelactone hydrolase family protein [Streptacidiphilus jiangxiensis]SEK86374.1 Dienelactone hydrolase [Streptacidiphilus jiangxiensis]